MTDANTYDFGAGPVPAHRHRKGGGWVADTATVAETAYVGPHATVSGHAAVLDHAVVDGYASVHGRARVTGHAEISGLALVCGSAHVCGAVRDNAIVEGPVAAGITLDGDSIVTPDGAIWIE